MLRPEVLHRRIEGVAHVLAHGHDIQQRVPHRRGRGHLPRGLHAHIHGLLHRVRHAVTRQGYLRVLVQHVPHGVAHRVVLILEREGLLVHRHAARAPVPSC